MVKAKLQKKNLPEAFTNWCPIKKKLQCGPPPVISWFISPSNFSYKYHKP